MLTLQDEAHDVFCFISEIEFGLGVASLADMDERWSVLFWLISTPDGGNSDPREMGVPHEEEQRPPVEESPISSRDAATPGGGEKKESDDEPLALVPHVLNTRWCFTKNDDDAYPSVPHGHNKDKTIPWPKLNPYTGRAYRQKDSEEKSPRLTRNEMINLRNDRDFRRHALETIAWYAESHPYYRFPVGRPLRLSRWKRRR